MGSAVIHSRTRASLVCTRPATAFRRSRSVRIPIRRPESSDDGRPDALLGHPLGSLPQCVLGGHCDDLTRHHIPDAPHVPRIAEAATRV